jgi:hypothetical protein
MTGAQFWACVILNIVLFMILNIWLVWLAALLLSICIIWGGFFVWEGELFD